MSAEVPTIAVVGGGITGLSAAWELSNSARPGTRIVVLESEGQVGGKLRSIDLWGRSIDLGPDAFVVRRPEAKELCDEVGLADDLVAPATGRAFVYSRRRLRPMPAGLVLGVPTRLDGLARSGICSPSGVLRAGFDLLGLGDLTPGPPLEGDAAVGPLVRRRLGREVQELLTDPLVGGINAGSTETMSAQMVFPQLLEASRSRGSLMRALRGIASPPDSRANARDPGAPTQPTSPIFMGLRGGTGRLAATLQEKLTSRGCDIKLNSRAEKMSPPNGSAAWSITTGSLSIDAHGVILAVPASVASRLLGTCDPHLERLLAGIEYASVTLVTHRLPAEAMASPAEGSGFLVPAVEDRLMTACTWISSKWPQLARSGEVLLRVSMGRYGDDRHQQLSDDEAIAVSISELESTMALKARPHESYVARWPYAFPQFFVGHMTRVEVIQRRAHALGALTIAGAALGGVGIPACIASGRSAARRLLSELSELPGPTS